MRISQLNVKVPAAELPVTAAEFVEHGRLNGITVQRQPALLERELDASTRRGEEYCRRAFMKQTLMGLFLPGGAIPELIQLPRGKVLALGSVSMGGAPLDPAAYKFDSDWGTITLLNGWPTSGVTVVWDAGYGEASTDVPAGIREGILQYATAIYGDRRGSREIKATADVGAELPPGVEDSWALFQIPV